MRMQAVCSSGACSSMQAVFAVHAALTMCIADLAAVQTWQN